MIFQKPYSKKYALMALTSGKLKMVFALLTKVIALHIQMIIIEIGVPRFEKPIKFVPSFANCSLVLYFLNTNSHKLLEKVIV